MATLAGCGSEAGAQALGGTEEAAPPRLELAELPEVPEEARRVVEELLAASVHPRLDKTSDHHDRWWAAYLERLEAVLEEADPDVGRAAIQEFARHEGEDPLGRRLLLTLAARCAPEDARELLRTLMLEYGYRIDDRTEALLLLAESSPEVFLEDARPWVLRRGRPRKTMPNDEFFVRGWVRACKELGRSPVPELADVLTNLWMEDMARHLAAETLGQHPDPLGRRALETALLESSGNGYVRRKAAQALRETLDEETLCTLLTGVYENEADPNFRAFLADMIQLECP